MPQIPVKVTCLKAAEVLDVAAENSGTTWSTAFALRHPASPIYRAFFRLHKTLKGHDFNDKTLQQLKTDRFASIYRDFLTPCELSTNTSNSVPTTRSLTVAPRMISARAYGEYHRDQRHRRKITVNSVPTFSRGRAVSGRCPRTRWADIPE